MFQSFKTMMAAAIMFAAGSAANAQEISMFGPPTTSYQGERTFSSENTSITQTIYSKAGKTRTEMTIEGMQNIQIWRMDKEVIWSLMPQQGIAVEIPFGSDQAASPLDSLKDQNGSFEKRFIAAENVNGVTADRYYVRGQENGGAQVEGHIWTTKQNITVRARMKSSSPGEPTQEVSYDLTNLVLKDHADSLFEIPAGYQLISTGGAMPGFGGALGGYAGDVAKDASNEAVREADRQVRGKARDEARKAIRKVLPW